MKKLSEKELLGVIGGQIEIQVPNTECMDAAVSTIIREYTSSGSVVPKK